jgi:hypothetical protein
MVSKRVSNKGIYIENVKVTGGEANFAGRDINLHYDNDAMTVEEFHDLLNKINSRLRAARLPKSDEENIRANIDIASKQTKKKEPNKSLILGPLTTALELIIQAGGAAQSIETLIKLLNQAISFAQKMF